MEAMRIIMDEHQALGAVLHAVRHLIGEIGAGRLKPDFALLRAMVHYLEAYPEKRHHPKEDQYLFAPLKRRTAEGAAALARLEREHAESETRIEALETALAAYTHAPASGLEGFAGAFEAYAAFYREHMLLEEREVLPLVVQHFTDADWAAAAAGFAANADPLAGSREGEEDFARLFSKLAAAAPPPIGFGDGPYREE
jgi:hemerythrin-like domain-containing protein